MSEGDGPSFRPGWQGQGRGHIVYEDITAFSFSQRLNRLRFACYSLSAWLITLLLVFLLAIVAAALKNSNPQLAPVALVAMAVIGLGWLIYQMSLVVRRLHDLQRSVWFAALLVLPFILQPALIYLAPAALAMHLGVSLIQPLFMLYLTASEGTPGMNPYGTPNPPNGFLVQFFGGIWWVFMVLTLLANFALVALAFFAPELIQKFMAGGADLEALERSMKELERQAGMR